VAQAPTVLNAQPIEGVAPHSQKGIPKHASNFKRSALEVLSAAAVALLAGTARAATDELALTDGGHSAHWQMDLPSTSQLGYATEGAGWLATGVSGNFAGDSRADVVFATAGCADR